MRDKHILKITKKDFTKYTKSKEKSKGRHNENNRDPFIINREVQTIMVFHKKDLKHNHSDAVRHRTYTNALIQIHTRYILNVF